MGEVEEALQVAKNRLDRLGGSSAPLSSDAITGAIQDALNAGLVDLMHFRGLLDKIVLPSDPDRPPVLHIFGQQVKLPVRWRHRSPHRQRVSS